MMLVMLRAPRVFPGHIPLRIAKELLEIIELERAGLAKGKRPSGNML
jgi:hypothetical protein